MNPRPATVLVLFISLLLLAIILILPIWELGDSEFVQSSTYNEISEENVRVADSGDASGSQSESLERDNIAVSLVTYDELLLNSDLPQEIFNFRELSSAENESFSQFMIGYENLIDALELPTNQKNRLEDALLEFGTLRFQLLPELLTGNLAPDQMIRYYGPEATTEHLSSYLFPEQSDVVREYESVINRQMLEILYAEKIARTGLTLSAEQIQQSARLISEELYSDEYNYGAVVSRNGSVREAYLNRRAAIEQLANNLRGTSGELDSNVLQALIDGGSEMDILTNLELGSSGEIQANFVQINIEGLR